MPKVTFIDALGHVRIVQAVPGESLMETARNNDIPGIDADCGGVCACATCHVYVDEQFFDRLPPPGSSEAPMLEFLDEPLPTSRLACQIEITDELDGLTVRTPATQK